MAFIYNALQQAGLLRTSKNVKGPQLLRSLSQASDVMKLLTMPAADLLPVDPAAVLFGQGCEGGVHLTALCRAMTRQVVGVVIA